MGPKFNDNCPYKRHTYKQRAENYMKMEAEVGVMQTQAKEQIKPPEAGRSREGFPKALEEVQPC